MKLAEMAESGIDLSADVPKVTAGAKTEQERLTFVLCSREFDCVCGQVGRLNRSNDRCAAFIEKANRIAMGEPA